jgi:hypothetical protein
MIHRRFGDQQFKKFKASTQFMCQFLRNWLFVLIINSIISQLSAEKLGLNRTQKHNTSAAFLRITAQCLRSEGSTKKSLTKGRCVNKQ